MLLTPTHLPFAVAAPACHRRELEHLLLLRIALAALRHQAEDAAAEASSSMSQPPPQAPVQQAGEDDAEPVTTLPWRIVLAEIWESLDKQDHINVSEVCREALYEVRTQVGCCLRVLCCSNPNAGGSWPTADTAPGCNTCAPNHTVLHSNQCQSLVSVW